MKSAVMFDLQGLRVERTKLCALSGGSLASVSLGSKDEGSDEESESDKCSHYFSASGVCEKR